MTAKDALATPEERLAQAFSRPPGFYGWLSAVNHRSIGSRYIITSFVFFLLAGILALAIRVQLAQPGLEVLGPETYNQFFTVHGTAMMFLFAVPMLEGLGMYFVPLMIGTRDMAFPRLNAFGYWTYLSAGILLFGGLLAGAGPDAGWFNYPPLSGAGFRPTFGEGAGIDFFLISVTMLEIAALVAAVELIVTVLKQRAPGMAISRMPLFVWAQFVTAIMIVFAMPAVLVASLLLELDRKIGTHFFNVAAGGDPLLWQHLFWFFGHPDVYIMLIPAFGIVSMTLSSAVQRPIVGYLLVATSIITIAMLSFGLWVHHMYATGLGLMGLNFFGAASMMIAIPSGIVIFAWIATLWRGAVRMDTIFLFSVGTIIIFVLGGITGVMVASPAFDWQAHDSYFVVAHFHYVLIGGVVFPIFAGLYYWLPKVVGRMPSDRLGRWSFWLTFIGFNVTFFPMHLLGFQGMPRRVYTYLPGLGLDTSNLLATIGAVVFGLGVLVLVGNVLLSFFAGERAPSNPWGAGTLEWATSSPPPQYNFTTIPVVSGRYPLWEQEQLEPAAGRAPRGWLDLADSPTLQRETYLTTVLDANPDAKALLPNPTILPLWLALAVTLTFAGLLSITGYDAEVVLVPIGALLTYALLLVWTWPAQQDVAETDDALPHSVSGSRATNWWGMIWLVVIEGVAFASLIFAYLYLRIGSGVQQWPPEGIQPPDLLLPSISTVLLLLSAGPVYWAVHGIRTGKASRLKAGLLTGMGLAAGALILSIADYLLRPYDWTVNAYASIFWVTGLVQTMHVALLLLIGVPLSVLAWRGHFDERRYLGVQVAAIFWWFVVATGVFVYVMIYVGPLFL